MFRLAYKHNDEIIFYFDLAGNKYVASGGSLAWRINNPGLVHCHSRYSCRNGSIGSCGRYAIFSNPQQGRKALIAWLHSKKYYYASIKTLAEHYKPDNPETFVDQVSSLAKISPNTTLKALDPRQFDRLVIGIEKFCGYAPIGNEAFCPLPKIIAKIENGKNQEDTYLIGDNKVLSKNEAIEWIQSHRLDAVIVHECNGTTHLRSRPRHGIYNIKVRQPDLVLIDGEIDVLVRTVGERKPNQCIWGFINGIANTEQEALASAEKISLAAGGEGVFSMPNDTTPFYIKDGLVCITLKLICDTPIVDWAAKFFRYLLHLAKKDKTHPPVIVFVHSQGAIITEHALELLNEKEREQLLIFTFGGGSFIAPGKSHPDSRNYASSVDFVCSLGQPRLQYLALRRYFGNKEGQSDKEVIYQLALQDAMFDLDSVDPEVTKVYANQRMKYYEQQFAKISNVVVLDPDPKWRHRFESSCYQEAIQSIVGKYRRN